MTDFRLKRAILKSGMKQLAIAEKAGIEEVRFSRIVNGHIEPTKKEKYKIAEAMGVEQERIFP